MHIHPSSAPADALHAPAALARAALERTAAYRPALLALAWVVLILCLVTVTSASGG